ncbi:MAG: SdrD B-like domain-containing protein [Anaerolineae bacterium]
MARAKRACTYDFWAGSATTQSNTDWIAVANAGSPNSSYAVGDSANNPSHRFNGIKFKSAASGNIVSVKAIYIHFTEVLLRGTQVDDLTEGQIYTTTSASAISTTVIADSSKNLLTPYIGAANQGILSWDITNLRGSWSFTDVNSLDVRLYLKKNGGDDGVILNVDSLGIRITTDQQCGGSSDTINPVPVSDTYNATLLQFTSASPLQTSSSTGGASPYTNTGTLTWSNIGPLYAGQTKSITVSFKGLEPAGNVATTITNTAAVNGAKFITGEPTNSGQSSITTTLQPTARIGDRVWNDNGNGGGTASNGVQDGGEVGIPSVTVQLLDGSSNVIMTATTSITGYYVFEGLVAGSYTVRVNTASLPGSTFTQTGDPQKPGVLCSTTPGANCDNQSAVTLTTADNLSQDFGYTVPTAIYGNVWQDNNGNSSQQGGENGIPTVTVVLYNLSNTPIQTTTTDANGDYVFGDVANGSYYVKVLTSTLPAGGTWTQTFDPDSTIDSKTITITTSGGNIYGPYNFAYTHTGTFSLGDTLYVDWNGDGDQDIGEEGIPNITVSLYEDSDGDGVISSTIDALIITATTTSTGFYQFSSLPR